MDWNTASSDLGGPLRSFEETSRGWNRSLASLQIASEELLDETLNPRVGGWKRATRNVPRSRATTDERVTGQQQEQQQQQQHLSASDAISQYEESLLERVRQESDERIWKKTNEVIENYVQKSWERKHNQWVDELIGRNIVEQNIATLGDRSPANGGSSSILAAISPGQGNGSRRYHENRLAWNSSKDSANQDDKPLDPYFIREHGLIIQDLTRHMPDKVASKFGQLALRAGTTTPLTPVQAGYATAWKWMEHLLQHQQLRWSINRGPKLDTIDQAIATLHHLSLQFYGQVENTVRIAVAAGQSNLIQPTYYDPIAIQCQAYTKLLFGAQALHTPWAVLYYCLRCGSGSVAALDVWQVSKPLATISDTVADSITRLLVAMKPWGQPSPGDPPRLSISDRHIVADYLQSLQQDSGGQGPENEANHQASVHQVGFLALLSGTGTLPNDSNVHGFSTIEDFLFGRISMALLQKDPEAALVQLGSMIQSYGPSYFGDSESGGWSYSLPLLMTQQYNKALTHLVEFGSNLGLLQATHLGLLLSNASIELSDLGHGSTAAQGDLAASLLVAYAGRLLAEPTAGSLAALEYLMLIRKRDRMRKEVASLIAKTGDLDKLAGRVDENGVRHGGEALGKHFSDQELSIILGDSAEMLLRENGDQQKLGAAAMCYMLAGRYDNVLRLLNDMLCPPNQQDAARMFWIEQTKIFHQLYLEKNTHVLKVLKLDGKLNLIQTSRYLIDLNIFFQHLNSGQFSDAWNLARSTKLLPEDRNDIASKQDNYRTVLDETIKRSFPAFLVGVMKSLYHLHLQTKNMGVRDAIAKDRLFSLRDYAGVLLSFAGVLGVASDDLSLVEAMMV